MWHRDVLVPIPSPYFLDFRQIPCSNPQDSLFRRHFFRLRPLEKGRKFPQRAGADEIERRNLFPELLIAADEHPSICKSKLTNDFRKESRLLDVRFDQKNAQLRPDDLQRQALVARNPAGRVPELRAWRSPSRLSAS